MQQVVPHSTRQFFLERLLEGRGWTRTRLVCDGLTSMLAVGAALLSAQSAHGSFGRTSVILLFPPLVMSLLALRGMYGSKLQESLLDKAGHVVGATSVSAMVTLAAIAVLDDASGQTTLIARVWVYSIAYVGGGRALLGLARRWARANRVVGKPTLIVGAGQVGAHVERRLAEQPELGLRPVGYLDAVPPPQTDPPRQAPILGGPGDLEAVVEQTGAVHVVFAFLSSRGSDAKLNRVVRQCGELGVDVSLVPRVFESVNRRVALEHIGGLPLQQMRYSNPKSWHFTVKYALDRALAALLLLLALPVFLLATLAVKLSSPGPVFFRQRRIGRDGSVFDLLKFRSMRLDPPDPVAAASLADNLAPGGVEGKDRRTRVGAFLRRTSLDELPQLINVLKGEMSLVGPRPERPEFVELFGARVHAYEDRHRVKSGMTGWAQVHGLRGKTSIADRIEWDNYYIANWSPRLDLKILLMTLAAIVRPTE